MIGPINCALVRRIGCSSGTADGAAVAWSDAEVVTGCVPNADSSFVFKAERKILQGPHVQYRALLLQLTLNLSYHFLFQTSKRL